MISEEIENYADILKALGHPTRLSIVNGLCNHGCNVTHIVDTLDIPQATISQHLSILRSHGIIKGQKKGLEVCYKVVNQKVQQIINILEIESNII
jgi:DNA-binding transcriptional ArsR family regulator